MTDLASLIQFWKEYLECYSDGHSPRFIHRVTKTINALEKLKSLREQSSGGEKE